MMATFEIHAVGWKQAKLVEMSLSDQHTDKDRRKEFLRVCDEVGADPSTITRLIDVENSRREWINLFR